MDKIVTRDSLKAMLDSAVPARKVHIVGHALLVLLANQTADEQASGQTVHHNGMGFGGCDAEFGTSCAKYYQRNKFLSTGQLNAWLKVGKSGYPKICKYWQQLDIAARAKSSVHQAA